MINFIVKSVESGSTTTYNILNISSAENATYVRVYDKDNSMVQGGWGMKTEDIAGLTPREIQNKFALSNTPKYIYVMLIWKQGYG